MEQNEKFSSTFKQASYRDVVLMTVSEGDR
jgi:hypothetical protein